MKNTGKGGFYSAFIILFGGIAGSIAGEVIGNNFQSLKFIKNVYSIGTVNPLSINLKFIALNFGINLNLNIMSIIGVILSIIFLGKTRK